MTPEDLEAALEGIEYEKDDESDSFIYYTITGPESSLDRIEIMVNREDNAVSHISVSYEPDELNK